MALMIRKDKKETDYIDTLHIYILWYEFSNVFVAQIDFGKKKNSQKIYSLSYLKYTLECLNSKIQGIREIRQT